MSCDFPALAASGVRRLKPYEPGKPVEQLERELGIRNAVKLASNENPLGPSPRAIEAIRAHAKQVSLYPDGNGFALKRVLASRQGVREACITLGNGSNDVLELIAKAFLGPGREAIFSQHAFAVYPIVTQVVGATARVAPANAPDHEMPFGHGLQAMLSLVNADTRVVFIANPNNPTGTWLNDEELKAFLDTLPTSTLCVVDEAYFEYVQETGYPNAILWLEQYPNLIVTRTFSKIYGLAGLRVGYSLSCPEVAELLNRARQPFNVSSVGQWAAEAALDDTQHVNHSCKANAAGLHQLVAACKSRGLTYIPSVANFICVDVGRPAFPVYQALLKEAVIVRPIANYGFPNHLRVTVGTQAQNQRVIDALDKVLTP